MPAGPDPRQPAAPLDWFSLLPGQGVLAAEDDVLPDALAALPDLPWLWLGTPAGRPPARRRPPLALRRAGGGWAGDLRCDEALPLPTDSLGAVVVQHAFDADRPLDPWLAEVVRVLAPGGTLWITALNPWSPYRRHWARTGLRARDPGLWQGALVRAGLVRPAMQLQWMGPRWRIEHGEAGVGALDRLRAAFALTAVKRVAAPVRPAPVRRLRLATPRGGWPQATGRSSPRARR